MPQSPPQAAIEFLNANPDKWGDFQAKYGELPEGFRPPSAPDAAVKFLLENPDKLPDFRAKYGYEPVMGDQASPEPVAPVAEPPSRSFADARDVVDLVSSISSPGMALVRAVVGEGAPQEERPPTVVSDAKNLAKRSRARLVSGVGALGELAVDAASDPMAALTAKPGGNFVEAAGNLARLGTVVAAGPGSFAWHLLSPEAASRADELIKAPLAKAREVARTWEQQAVDALSPDVQDSIQKQLIERDEAGELQFGEGARDPWYWAAQGIDMATMMAPGIGAAGWAARASYTARYGAALAQAGLRKVPQSVALRFAETQAQKAAVQAATIAGGLAEGTIAGGMNAEQVQQTIEQVDEETLMNYPAYREMREQGLPHEVARGRIARNQAFAAAIATATITGLTGAPLNGFIGRLATGAAPGISKAAGKAAVLEGGQEFVQEGSDALVANKAEQPITGRDTWEGVLESAITGGILGGILGGGVGAAGGTASKPDTAPQRDLAAKQKAYQDAAENLRSAQEAASDPSIRIDKATIDEARQVERTAKIALGQAMLQSGKLSKKQQASIAQAISEAQASGIAAESAPIQGEIRDNQPQPGAATDQAGQASGTAESPATAEATPQAEVLNEAETARSAALERVASADTIEAADLNSLVSAGLAKTNSTGRPILTAAGRRQRTELAARASAAEQAAAKPKVEPEPAKAEVIAESKAGEPKLAPTDLREPDFQTLERLDSDKPISAEEAAVLVRAGLIRAKVDGSFVIKPAGKRQLRDYKQSGRQLPVEKEFEATVEDGTLKLPREKRGARRAAAAKVITEQTLAAQKVAADKQKQAQVDATFADRVAKTQAAVDRDVKRARNQKADQDVAIADATQLNTDTSIEDALAAAKGNIAARRAKTEKAEAESMVELADLEAVQSGEATFGQIGGLAQRGLARKNADGTGTLLPAGKRRLNSLKRLPLRDEASEVKRAKKAAAKVAVVKNGDTYSVQVGKETVIASVSKETADAVVADLSPTTKEGPKKLPRKAKPKGKLVTPSGEPIVAGVSPEQAKELTEGVKGVKRVESRLTLDEMVRAVSGTQEADERLLGARLASQTAKTRVEEMGFAIDGDGAALTSADGQVWVWEGDSWIGVDGPIPTGIAALGTQYRRSRQAVISAARPILEMVRNEIKSELGVELQLADSLLERNGSVSRDDGNVSGEFIQNPIGEPEMWLYATGTLSYKQAYDVAVHEVVGHYGLRGVLGVDYPRVMRQIRKEFPGAVKAAAKRNGFDEIEHPDLAAEELVAYSTEMVFRGDVSAPKRSIWRRVVNAVRRAIMASPWLQKKTGTKMTVQDVEDLILRARDFVRRRPMRAWVNEARYAKQVARAMLQPQVEVSANVMTVRVQGGSMTAEIDRARGTLQVRDAQVAKGARGQGLGVQMAEQLFAEAQARGLTLISDNRVSDNAARVYEALERRGYTVKRNPANVDRGTGELTSKSELKGVFEVIAAPDPQFTVWNTADPEQQLSRAKRHWASVGQDVAGIHVVPIAAVSPNQDSLEKSRVTRYATDMDSGKVKFPPIIVDSVGRIVDGHHRYFAAKARGMTRLPVIELFDSKTGPKLMELLTEDAGPGVFSKIAPQTDTAEPSVTGQIAKRLTDNGGFTMNPFSGAVPKPGWAFSPRKDTERVFDFMPSAMDLQQYIVENAAALRTPGTYLGGWRDATTGKVYIDVSRVLPDAERPAAVKAAKAAGQLAIFNLGTQETVRFEAAKPSKAQLEAQQTIAKLSQYLTPEERQMVNRATAKKLVDLFAELPSDRDLAAAAIAGQAKRGWYRKSAEALVNIFGPDSARFAALLAALSPQTSVEGNLTNAVRVWKGWVEAGRPTDPKEIIQLMGRNVVGLGTAESVLGAWRNNSIRALTAEDPENIQLSGPKVDSFAANLRGEANAVTLDTWLANFALVDQRIFGGTLTKQGVSGKRFGYLAYSARVRQAAERLTKMTGEVWTPAEVQETVWSWAKALYEHVDSFGGLATAQDLVADNELTDALINATPDFAALFQNDEYANVLREAGYGPAIDRLAEQTAAERGTPSKKVAPLEGDQKRLIAAAKRLDELRKQRREAEGEAQTEEVYSILGGNTGDPDLDSFLNKFGGPKRTLRQMWKDWTDSLADRTALQVFDQFHGIKRAETLAGISAADSGYISARLSGNSAELVRAMLEFGYPVWNGGAPDVAGGMGLMQILKPLGSNINLWLAYMVAKRADRLAGENRENLFQPQEIQAALKLGQQHPEFDVVAKRYADFQAKVLDFGQAAGIIDPTSRALWENADYIPFYRIIDSGQVSQSTNAGSLGRVANTIRQLRGGDQNLGDPLENIVRNWMAMTDAALKANAARETIDNLNGTGLVTRAPQFEITSAIVPLAQIKTWIKNNPILVQTLNAVGLDPAKLSPQAFQGLQKMMAVQAPTDEDVISVWRNGKREYWKVHDELLLTSLQRIDAKAWGPLMEIFRFPKRLLTAMVTSTPQFAVKNLWRDMWHAFVQGAGRETIVPGVDTVKGTIEQLRMGADAQSVLAGGGSFTHGYIRAGDLKGGAATVRGALRGRTASGRILNSPRAVWEFYRGILNASENAHRVQIYRRLLAQGKTRKEALYGARDMLDFSMRGRNAVVRFLIESVPFLNARMQGLYRIGRGFKANFAAIAIRGLLLTAATTAIFAGYQDDERYRELTDDQKNLYWHFWDVFEDGDHWKLPKPFEVGAIFATIPEAILDATMASDPEPDAAKQALKLVGHAFTEALNLSPQVQTIWPVLELAIKKNTFTGAPILNMGDENVLPEDQDSPRLSPTYRALARAMPDVAPEALRSPKQLEHLGRGYLGNLQDYVLLVTDSLVRKMSGEPAPPERATNDWPGLRDFRSEGPSRHTKYLDAMYAIADEAEKVAASVRRNEEKGSAEGDKRGEELEADNAPLLDVRKDFAKAVKEATKIRQEQRNIQLDPDTTPAEKREEIDALQQDLNDLAKELYDLRPGGRLNPETASLLIGVDASTQARTLRTNGLPATARLLEEWGNERGTG